MMLIIRTPCASPQVMLGPADSDGMLHFSADHPMIPPFAEWEGKEIRAPRSTSSFDLFLPIPETDKLLFLEIILVILRT